MNFFHSILTSQGGAFDPSSLTPFLWLDATSEDYYTSTDNLDRLVTVATARTGQSFIPYAASGDPSFNGEGYYFNSIANGLVSGTVSDYNDFHNGGDFTMYFLWKQLYVGAGHSGGLFADSQAGGTNRGFALLYTGNTDALTFNISNGTVNAINITAASIVNKNAYNIVKVTKSGNTVTMYTVNISTGIVTQRATQTAVQSFSASNAAFPIAVGTLGGAGLQSKSYIKHLLMWKRILTASEQLSMEAFLVTQATNVIIPTNINIYITAGDSNDAGRAPNNTLAADLTGVLSPTKIVKFATQNPNSTCNIEYLEAGVNQTVVTEGLTNHGVEMRFGKTMGDIFIMKYAQGSTFMIADWNVTRNGTNYQRIRTAALVHSIPDVVHVLRRTPVFRGFIWMQGANDSFIGATGVSWSRSGTTVTITQNSHGRATGQWTNMTTSSDVNTIPLGPYMLTVTNANTYTITGINAGGTSGTLSHDAGSAYKQGFYDFFNSVVDYINNTLFNEITGGTGYSSAKIRLAIVRTKNPTTSANATSLANVIAAQTSIGTDYLTDNPTYSSKCAGSVSFSSDSAATIVDGVHYSSVGYETIALDLSTYYLQYFNE